jgi:type VI protein secretion system component VasA
VRDATGSSPQYATFESVGRITPLVPAPLDRGDLLWSLVACTGRGRRTLTDVDSLRRIIALHDTPALWQVAARQRHRELVSGLTSVRVVPRERLWDGALIRGSRLDVEVEDRAFRGPGARFLFGAVINEVFAAQASLNTFTECRVIGRPSADAFTWTRLGRDEVS